MVICPERGADCLHMVQLMPLPSADGSAVCTWLSCRQPACQEPRAAARLRQLCHGTDRRTDGTRYRGGHNSWLHYPIHRRHSSGDWATTHRPRHRSKAEHEPSRSADDSSSSQTVAAAAHAPANDVTAARRDATPSRSE